MSIKRTIAVGVAAALLTGATAAAGVALATQSSESTRTTSTPGFFMGGGRGGGFGGPGRGMRGMGGRGGMAGTVTAKDGDSVTVKTPDGWSRTFKLSDSVTYRRVVDASASDVKLGSKVQLGARPDGTGDITLDAVTIVPELPTFTRGAAPTSTP